jgi:hypothetical protein
MSENSNTDIALLLQSLTQGLDALQKDVDTIKEDEVRRSATRSPSPTSEAETSRRQVPVMGQSPQMTTVLTTRWRSRKLARRQQELVPRENPGVGGRTALGPDHRDPALNHVRPEEGDTGRTPLRGAVRIKGKAVTWKNPAAGLIACPTPRARKWTIPEPSFLATQGLRISLIQN